MVTVDKEVSIIPVDIYSKSAHMAHFLLLCRWVLSNSSPIVIVVLYIHYVYYELVYIVIIPYSQLSIAIDYELIIYPTLYENVPLHYRDTKGT